MTECTCDEDIAAAGGDPEYSQCDVHVHCEDHCRALQDPQSPDEIRAAYEHWRIHGYIGGCAHGC